MTVAARMGAHHLTSAADLPARAVQATAPGDIQLSIRLGNLSTAHLARFAADREPTHLDDAIEVMEQAMAAITTDEDVQRTTWLLNGARLRAERWGLTGRPDDLEVALASYREAAGGSSSAASVRLAAAYSWAQLALAADDVPLALEGYRTAVGLLSMVAWRGTERGNREEQLALWSTIAGDAAACAVACGDDALAVELLEEGRTVLWRQALETRSDLSALHAVDPDLARELDRVRTALDATPPGPEADPAGSAAFRDRAVAHGREWDDLLRRVRVLPGMDGFLRPTPFRELAEAVGDRVVVLVNVSALRSDALLVAGGEVAVVPLPLLDRAALDAVAESDREVVLAMRRYTVLSRDERGEAERVLDRVTTWLWEAVARPVLDAMELEETEGTAPVLWWCPTGKLALLRCCSALLPTISSGETSSVLYSSVCMHSSREASAQLAGSARSDSIGPVCLWRTSPRSKTLNRSLLASAWISWLAQLSSRYVRFFVERPHQSLDHPARPQFGSEASGVACSDAGQAIGGVRHQFRTTSEGFHARLCVEFPPLTMPHMISQHRWHLACECSNWIEFAFAEAR